MVKIKHDRVFPKVLHRLLQAASAEGWDHVASWNPDGRSFKIHDRQQFLNVLAAQGMKQTHYKSFVRQLNLWGFACIHGGKRNAERGSYFHSCFLRDDFDKIEEMTRTKVKGKAGRSNKAGVDKKKVVVAKKLASIVPPEEEEASTVTLPLLDLDSKVKDYNANDDNDLWQFATSNDEDDDDAFDVTFFEYLEARPWALQDIDDNDNTAMMNNWIDQGFSLTEAEFSLLLGV